jgi:hypothetical protein
MSTHNPVIDTEELGASLLWERNAVYLKIAASADRVPAPVQVLTRGGLKAVLIAVQQHLEQHGHLADWQAALHAAERWVGKI